MRILTTVNQRLTATNLFISSTRKTHSLCTCSPNSCNLDCCTEMQCDVY
ncbi:hypothetical protein DNTS_028416 [Danionella cerebrum]|uniref:Uncharacterized protein n=1 Tax=Danionella cerebrum TaxID=2873325 RepID=A0A553NW51_9TELE|nr:hypothetical protein DNTS_028416 [Danionella translucida]